MCTCTHVHFYILYCHLRKYILILFSLAKKKNPFNTGEKRAKKNAHLKGILYVHCAAVHECYTPSKRISYFSVLYAVSLFLCFLSPKPFFVSKAFFHNVFFFIFFLLFTQKVIRMQLAIKYTLKRRPIYDASHAV